ncbi:MAG: chromate transporter [Oscillospiraceae bacterium]|nr:chromate transporter [Oscillospiraceae bacterium]
MILLKLFWTFFKIGAFTFGGGYAMIPLIQQEVTRNGWLTVEQVIDFIAVSESTPGPFAVNMSTYVGAEKAGILGALCTVLGVILPSFVIILIVAQFFEKFKSSKTVQGIMSGLKPAVIGMIATAAVSVAQTVFAPNGFSLGIFTSAMTYVSLLIFAIGFVMAIKKLHPIVIICVSAVLGIIAGYVL